MTINWTEETWGDACEQAERSTVPLSVMEQAEQHRSEWWAQLVLMATVEGCMPRRLLAQHKRGEVADDAEVELHLRECERCAELHRALLGPGEAAAVRSLLDAFQAEPEPEPESEWLTDEIYLTFSPPMGGKEEQWAAHVWLAGGRLLATGGGGDSAAAKTAAFAAFISRFAPAVGDAEVVLHRADPLNSGHPRGVAALKMRHAETCSRLSEPGAECLVCEALAHLRQARDRHRRYSEGVKAAIGDDRAKRDSGELARSDANEIRRLQLRIASSAETIREYEAVLRDHGYDFEEAAKP